MGMNVNLTPTADGIDVVRVLHGSRDLDEQFR